MAVLYTTVPYLWRRHLSAARVLLALAGLAVYLIFPIPYSLPVVLFVAAYAAFGIFNLFRDSMDASHYPPWHLMLDGTFFVVCALHPGEQGLWLTTAVYFFLLLLSTLLYSWRFVAAVVLLSAGFVYTLSPQRHSLIWPAIVLGGTLAVVFSLQRQHLQDRLSSALKRSVLSRSEAELAREQERQRIANDFHDGPLQSFISFQMRLEIVRKLMTRDSEAAMSELIQLQEFGRGQVTELRAFVRGMQPAEVTPRSLGASIREAVEHFERDSGITAELFCDDLSSVDEASAGELLQVVREALNNVRKHSKASRVSLAVEAEPKTVLIRVEDDGSGFPFSGSYTLDELEILRLGPKSIQRRVRTLGGDLTLDSRPTQGASLTIRIPAAR